LVDLPPALRIITSAPAILELGRTKATTAPDLHDYEWIVINSSGGKDSQTALRNMALEIWKQGYPPHQVVVSHQDLDEIEWPGASDLAKEQADAYNFRFEISRYRNKQQEELTLLDYVEARGMWPSSDARFCTSEFKRGPGNRILTRLKQERSGKILQVFGFRAEESPARKKKNAFAINERASTQKSQVFDFLNIHHWSTQHVWDDIHESGIPHHWAYDIGMPRLSCAFCIMAPEAALALAARHLPDLFKKYLAAEEKTGHRFKKDISLRQIAEKLAANAYPETQEITNWRM
jgi:3'-phosphoadenosine 5'-phosphosulfate sulfotransferase (PAPS reductase)/FAD synthetase